MNLGQLLLTCVRSILRNRMRSLLTSLGVIIGVASVIIMLALGEGSQKAIEAQITAMGTNLLQAMPRRRMNRSGQSVSFRISAFTKEDLRKIREEASYLAAVSGVTQGTFAVTGGQGNVSVQVQGVEPGFFTARSWSLEEGYLFDEEDLANRNTAAILGQTTVKSLFGGADEAMGKQIRIGSAYFTVIGVLKGKGASMGGQDQDDIIMVPLDTAMYRLNNSSSIGSIAMSVAGKEYMEAAQREIEMILRESRRIAANADPDFDIMNQANMIDMAQATTKTLTTLLAAIAGVSLLVGGIGIMNIMLVSVTERTREIGIRMAVGARKRDILFQFLAESVILSLMGGIIGIGTAFLSCRIMSAAGVPASINPVVVTAAALFAAMVGIFFGFYPARKAARLYPIDALRFE